MTLKEWETKGAKLFGPDKLDWRFVCPSCGHVATVQDWKEAGAPEGAVAFSCVGRALGTSKQIGAKSGPCNYAGGGLFKLNPIKITHDDGEVSHLFAFDETGAEPE